MHKDMGLVSQVFGQEELAKLKGTRAIGHTRYSTTGTSTIKNAQPFVVDCVRGQMAIAHNGNLINADVLRDELERRGSIFQTTADSEIILHLLAQPSDNGGNVSGGVAPDSRRVLADHHERTRADRSARSVWLAPALRSANSTTLISWHLKRARLI